MIPSTVRVRCLADGRSHEGALVTLTLPMRAKNPYRLIFGPSNAEGIVEISWAELLQAAEEERSLALMDFEALPDGWSGALEVEQLGRGGVVRAKTAVDVWGEHAWAAQHADELLAYDEHLQQLGDAILSAQIIR